MWILYKQFRDLDAHLLGCETGNSLSGCLQKNILFLSWRYLHAEWIYPEVFANTDLCPPSRAFGDDEVNLKYFLAFTLMFCDPSKSFQPWIFTNNAFLPQGKLFLGQWRRCLISPPAQNTDEGSLFRAAWRRGMLLPGELKLTSHTYTVRTSPIEIVCIALWSHTH